MTGSSRPPSTPAIELGLQLKAERERPRPTKRSGYAKTEIPKNIITDRTLLEIEEGRKRTIKRGLVRDICAFYETDPKLIEHLVQLADATYMDEWTDAYSGAIDKDGWLYQQREDRAASLAFHDSIFIPSLIQPPSYINMIARTTEVVEDHSDLDHEQALRFRMSRQERWIESCRPMTCLIGEAAFALDLGNGVNEDLQEEVLKLAQLSFADIRVIPFSAGRYDLMGWEVSLLEFANGEEPVIRTKSHRGAGFVSTRSAKGKFFRTAFDKAANISIPAKEFLS